LGPTPPPALYESSENLRWDKGSRMLIDIYNVGKKTRDEKRKKGSLSRGWKTASHLPARRITWIYWQSPSQGFFSPTVIHIDSHSNMSQGLYQSEPRLINPPYPADRGYRTPLSLK